MKAGTLHLVERTRLAGGGVALGNREKTCARHALSIVAFPDDRDADVGATGAGAYVLRYHAHCDVGGGLVVSWVYCSFGFVCFGRERVRERVRRCMYMYVMGARFREQ